MQAWPERAAGLKSLWLGLPQSIGWNSAVNFAAGRDGAADKQANRGCCGVRCIWQKSVLLAYMQRPLEYVQWLDKVCCWPAKKVELTTKPGVMGGTSERLKG